MVSLRHAGIMRLISRIQYSRFSASLMGRKKTLLAPRKMPRQSRSRQMREDILAASIRVLRKEGPLRFTTHRVAETAGISVGSLYQYFPNKQSLVFAIHSRTTELAWQEMQRILDDETSTARARIARLAHMFFFAESDEVGHMGKELTDTEIFFDAQPGQRALRALVLARLMRFLKEHLSSGTSDSQLKFDAQLIFVVIESVGKRVAAMQLPQGEVGRWADASATMICDRIGL
jgi:AcrR family transcriptional regulator